MSPQARGRGRCTGCDRVFTLTYKGTVPAHVAGARSCEGGNRPPKAGSETLR